MTNEIVVVSGLARCGSSMTMQMLNAGGMKCFGQSPAWEDTRVCDLPREHNWLGGTLGGAVKILDPLTFTPPRGYNYRVIWLDRDTREQAKSWVKLERKLAEEENRIPEWTRRDVPRIRDMINSLRTRSVTLLNCIAVATLAIRFEWILKTPDVAADKINVFVGGGLDVRLMSSVVVKRRPECLKGLLELKQLENERCVTTLPTCDDW